MSTSFKGLTITVGADTKQFNKEMRQVDRSIKETNKQVDELQKSLELEFDSGRFAEAQRLAQDAIQGTEAKAQALREQLKFMEEAGTEKTNANYQKLQTELLKTENQAVLLKKRLEEINNLKIEALANKFKSAGDAISKAGQALAPFSAAAAGALAGLGAIGKSAIKSADELKTMADRINLSAEELQKWQYIAMQTDVSNEELQAGLVKTQGAFGSLAKGDIDVASQALIDLGFTAEQASKGMAENFDELVKRLSGIQDPIIQAAYANEIFGERMGSKLIPMLKAGGDGLAALAAEFETFDTLTNEQIESLAEFDNVMNRIKFSLKAIKDQMGVALLPVMQTIADFITNKVLPAVKALSEWFGNLSDRQKNLIVGVLAAVAALAPMLMITGKITSGIGGLINSLGGLSKAFSLLAAHPIIAAIAAIAAILVYLYTTNEKFRESINNLVSTLGEALAPIMGKIGELFHTIFTAIGPLLQVLGNTLVPVIDLIAKLMKPIGDIMTGIIMRNLTVMLPIMKAMISVITVLANVLSSILIPVFEWLSKAFDNFIAFIPKAIESVLKFIERMVNDVLDFINAIIRNINKMGDVLGFTIKELDHVSINTDFTKSMMGGSKAETSGGTATNPVTPSQVISSSPTANVPSLVTNNDYSNKDIVINVTVQNYADELDVDDIARQVNLKLAAQM